MLRKFLGLFDSDDNIGWLRVDILEYDEIINSNIVSTWNFPNQHLLREDNERGGIGHIIDFDASLIIPSYLQIPN